MWSSFQGHLAVVQALLEAGAAIDIKKNVSMRTDEKGQKIWLLLSVH
jgi:hypothetical protein